MMSLLPHLQSMAVMYDPQYALRLCTEHGQKEACVYIYAAMGLYEESVDLALEVGGARVWLSKGSPISI